MNFDVSIYLGLGSVVLIAGLSVAIKQVLPAVKWLMLINILLGVLLNLLIGHYLELNLIPCLLQGIIAGDLGEFLKGGLFGNRVVRDECPDQPDALFLQEFEFQDDCVFFLEERLGAAGIKMEQTGSFPLEDVEQGTITAHLLRQYGLDLINDIHRLFRMASATLPASIV